jgi:hypothetical protein
MAGKPGRTAPNRIPPEVHWLRGTFRKDRHTRPSSSKTADWTPTAPQLAALGVAGRAFVDRVRADYVFVPLEGEVVLQAAQVLDRLEALRQARDGADLALRLKLDRVEQGWLRQYAMFLNALKVSR